MWCFGQPINYNEFSFYFVALCRCWWGYNFTSVYWILEGPRLAMLLVNFVFLLNIIRVLIVKLRRTNTSEIDQARKAVRAAIFLIPLLGITNILNMTEAPLERTPFEFAMWSYTTHFLTSFQGFFIATLYCFLNNEVSRLEILVLFKFVSFFSFYPDFLLYLLQNIFKMSFLFAPPPKVQTEIIKNIGVYMSNRGNLDWFPRRNQSAAYAFTADTEAQPNQNR